MINYTEKYRILEYLNDNGVTHRISDNTHIFESKLTDEQVQSLMDNYDPLLVAKSEAYTRINEQLQSFLDGAISFKYSRAEQDTFPYQRLEVEAWQKDSSSPTPTIDSIAFNRNVDRTVQLEKIAAKTVYFANITSVCIGKVQGLKDQVKTSINLDFINSINFEP